MELSASIREVNEVFVEDKFFGINKTDRWTFVYFLQAFDLFVKFLVIFEYLTYIKNMFEK